MMRHLLTTILTFHWTAVFGLLAIGAMLDGDAGVASVLSMMGVGYAETAEHAPVLSMLLSFGLAVVTVLFFWGLLTGAFARQPDDGETMEVLRLAFAGAALLLTAVVLLGALQDVSGLFPVTAAHLAALLVSYLAICAERWAAALSTAPGQEDIRAAARVMALGAAHSTMLARLSGRAGTPTGEPG